MARYGRENWLLDRRSPRGVAEQARCAYSCSATMTAGAEKILCDRFLEVDGLVASLTRSDAWKFTGCDPLTRSWSRRGVHCGYPDTRATIHPTIASNLS